MTLISQKVARLFSWLFKNGKPCSYFVSSCFQENHLSSSSATDNHRSRFAAFSPCRTPLFRIGVEVSVAFRLSPSRSLILTGWCCSFGRNIFRMKFPNRLWNSQKTFYKTYTTFSQPEHILQCQTYVGGAGWSPINRWKQRSSPLATPPPSLPPSLLQFFYSPAAQPGQK